MHDLIYDIWKKYHEMHVSSSWCTHAPKVSKKNRKNCVPEFQNLSAFELPWCGLLLFIDMNTYILTEWRNFKTFLKENYPIALDSYYLFTKKLLNMKLNIVLIVPREFTCIKYSWTLQQVLWTFFNLNR